MSEDPNLTPVILYGHLRKRFGRRFNFAVNNPAESIRALCTVVPGFKDYLLKHSEPGYRVLVGNEARCKDDLSSPMGLREVIKIVPVVVGAKSPGATIIVGAALIVIGFLGMTYGQAFGGAVWGPMLVNAGIGMMVGGVAGLLSSSPPYVPATGDKGPSDRPAYSFNSPHMTIGQGNPIPVLLGGPLRIGGAMISMGISSQAWPINGLGGKAPDQIGTRGGDGDVNPWVWAVAPA